MRRAAEYRWVSDWQRRIGAKERQVALMKAQLKLKESRGEYVWKQFIRKQWGPRAGQGETELRKPASTERNGKQTSCRNVVGPAPGSGRSDDRRE